MIKVIQRFKYRLAALALALASTFSPARADYSNTVATLGPVGYWRFNEPAGSPPLNLAVNASTMGSILDGAIVLDVDKGVAGKVGQAARFHNPGVAAGYQGSKIDVPFNAALNKSGPFSVECWVNPAALGTDATGMAILSSMMNDFVASSRRGYLIYINTAGRFEFRLGNSLGYVGTVNNAATPALNGAVGQWRHVVGVFTGTDTQLIIDGVLAASTTLTAAQIASLGQNTQMPFRIGGTPFNGSLSDSPLISAGGVSGNRGVDGTVDEVAYYPYALTPAQCAAHFNTANSNPSGYGALVLSDNPVGYWPLNDAAYPTPTGPLPTVKNSGSAGSAADGTVVWGGLTGQPGAGYTEFGADNKSVLLDGANGFVKLPAPAALDITGNITMMAWIKPSVKNFFRDVIARGWDTDYKETFLRIARGTDLAGSGFGTTNHYEVGVSDGSFYDSVLVPMPEGDIGNWVFLAGTYDGTKWTLYRNGKEIGSLETPNGAIVTTNAWAIGAQSDADAGGSFEVPGGISTFFGGSIDEPAIFDKALTPAEIASIYDAAKVSPVITKSITSPDGYSNSVWPTLFKGGSATLSVWAEGSPGLTYQWYSNNVSLGVTTTNLVLNNLQNGTPTYAVVVSNPFGTVTNSVTLNIVAAPPSFTTQPVSLARFSGVPFTFSVRTGGTTPQTFQWKTNGVDIPGATSATYTGTANVGLNGMSYTVVASNEAGSVSSAPATVTVLPAPTGYAALALAESPIAYWRLGESTGPVAFDYVGNNNGVYANATLGQDPFSLLETDKSAAFSGDNSFVGQINGAGIDFHGTNASFTIEAWVKGAPGQPDESTIIAKGTGSDGTTANEQFGIDVALGHYRFFTRGSNNSIYSAEAGVGPDGTWQHVVGVYDQTNPEQAQMRIYVNGELQGSANGRPVTNGGLRESTSPVSIGSKRLGNATVYDGTFNGQIDEVSIYATALSASSIEAQYAAAYGSNTPPQIGVQPRNVTNYATLSATFSASAFGTVPLSYQWKKNGVAINGATASTYTISGLASSDAGAYTVDISNAAGSTNSAVANLTVLNVPTTPQVIPDLVVHLPFDDNLTDVTGRGNNGTAYAQTSTSSNAVPATFVDGRLGRALHYESDFGIPAAPAATTTTNTSYVSLGVRPDLQFGTNTDFTIAFWIRLPQDFIGGDLPFFTTTQGSLGGQGIVLSPAYGYGIGGGAEPDTAPLNYGGWGASLYDAGSANGARIYGEIGSINDGGWHHLVYVFDRDSQLVVYLDGAVAKAQKIDGTTTAAAKDIDTGLAATIGQDPTGLYQETGSGDIDDLGVWRRALTPLEVAALYVTGANNLSYFGVGLTISKNAGAITLTWDAGVLQQADVVTGPYADVTGATSPTIVSPTGTSKFYRLRY